MAVCNGTPFTVEKLSPGAGFDLATARSVGQRLTHWAIVAPAHDITKIIYCICKKLRTERNN